MLVLSRKIGESVVVDELIITVDSFASDHLILSRMRTDCEFLGKVTVPYHDYVEVATNVRAVMIRAERDKVRLGFEYPRNVRIDRWELWNPGRPGIRG